MGEEYRRNEMFVLVLNLLFFFFLLFLYTFVYENKKRGGENL